MATKITRDILESFVHCTYKAHLKLAREHGRSADYEILQREARTRIRHAAADRLVGRHKDEEILREVALTRSVLKQGMPLLLEATFEDDALSIHFDALQKEAGRSRLGDFHYIPVVVHEAERPRRQQKELLELYGVILGNLQGRQPGSGILMHGQNCTVRRIKLRSNGQRTQRALQEITEMQAGGTAPHLILNSHCQMCEFRHGCQTKAMGADDLSLLGGMSTREIRKHNRKGIFTVTQLSYTFRPRKRRKRAKQQSQPHHSALQALAIREKKVYVYGTPPLPDAATRVYFDIEGDPDRQSAYLLGMIIERNGREERHSFWADSPDEEPQLFQHFLDVVGPLDDFCLYTYGSYETAFLRRMTKQLDRDELGDKILTRVFNVLSLIHAYVYVPTYSNSLKDIGRYLGFTWTDPDASGLQSIVWRRTWEETGAANFKERLTTYNMEDCAALRVVTEFMYNVCRGQQEMLPSQSAATSELHVSRVEDIRPASSRREWCRPEFAVQDFAFVSERAHFDYQRDRVFIRTNPVLKRRLHHRHSRQSRKTRDVNRSLLVTTEVCPNCGSRDIVGRPNGRLIRHAYDLRFTRSGIRRWVTRFSTLKYRCNACEGQFLSKDYLRAETYCHSLKCWAMHEHVAYRSSFGHIAEKAHDYFGVPIATPNVYALKGQLAQYYTETYQLLLDKIVKGGILHTDETSVHVRTQQMGYVWVFSNMEEVVYQYRPSREGGFLHDLLKDFHGVLISDFYAAYDSLPCEQQKCLVHLIRDLNHDIQTDPWDNELKALASGFGRLLRTIMATVDQYGLRQRHLGKHRRDVDRFFRMCAGEALRSEVAEGYRQRLIHYREKLFIFLNHDGVPWNNNNAEHAMHRFAYYREMTNGQLNEAGMRDYLVLLSIYQTCRYKEVSFLQFLLSREKDIDVFCANPQKRPPLPTIDTNLRDAIAAPTCRRAGNDTDWSPFDATSDPRKVV